MNGPALKHARPAGVRVALARIVSAEALDGLAADDPAALRARLDLRRVHRVMRTRHSLLRALQAMVSTRQVTAPFRILELGAGDGSLMVGVARALAPSWPRTELTLLDRQPVVDASTLAAYARAGWSASTCKADVLDWAGRADTALRLGHGPAHWDLIVSNLFLHHFDGTQLDALLRAVATSTSRFLALEPRRGWLALAGSHLIGALGVNAVTRHDAVLSVHAGFRAKELSSLWPGHGAGWTLQESSAGLFLQQLRAVKTGGPI